MLLARLRIVGIVCTIRSFMGRRRWRIIVLLMSGLFIVFTRVDGRGYITSDRDGVDNCEKLYIYISFLRMRLHHNARQRYHSAESDITLAVFSRDLALDALVNNC